MPNTTLKVCVGQMKISGAENEWQRGVLIMGAAGEVIGSMLLDGTSVEENDLDDFEELDDEGCFHIPVS